MILVIIDDHSLQVRNSDQCNRLSSKYKVVYVCVCQMFGERIFVWVVGYIVYCCLNKFLKFIHKTRSRLNKQSKTMYLFLDILYTSYSYLFILDM